MCSLLKLDRQRSTRQENLHSPLRLKIYFREGRQNFWDTYLRKYLLCVGFLANLAVIACGPSNSQDSSTVATTNSGPLPEIIAYVNGNTIERAEFERAIRSAENQARQAVPPQLRDDVYRQVLDRLINFHLLLGESQVRGLLVENKQVIEEIKRIQSELGSETTLESQLSQWQSDIDELRKETRNDLLVSRVIDSEIKGTFQFDETSVRTFYDQHREQFQEGAAVRARHILIATPLNANDETVRAAKAHADSILLEALKEGADFPALAIKYSSDEASAQKGGDLGFITKGRTVPSFEEALFKLDPEEISEVVKSPFGFHVIKAINRREQQSIPFEEASSNIRSLLIRQARENLIDDFISQLRTSATIEIFL